MNSNENLPPQVMQRLMKEIRAMCKNPPEGITLKFDDEKVTNINATIQGPVGTPFEGGEFVCKLILGQDFPQVPPKGLMRTRIFHPNVSKEGEICVNTLKKDWSASLGLGHVLTVIRCLLIHPNPDSALNEDAGKLLQESYEEYAERARIMTKIHAQPKKKLTEEKEKTTETDEVDSALVPKKMKSKADVKAADKKKKGLKRL